MTRRPTHPAGALAEALAAVLAVLPLLAAPTQGAPSAAAPSSALEKLQHQPQETLVQGQAYLTKYGWLSPTDSRFGSLQSLSSKVSEFQKFAGLDVTGVLDDATMAKMQQPRCGVPDKPSAIKQTRRRRKRFALEGSKWRSKDLTYKIVNWPASRDQTKTRKALQDAFKAWSDVSALTFTEVSGGTSAKIDIRFEYSDHGDGDPFDGPGGTLAHAFFPIYGGDAHFDKSEEFIVDPVNDKYGVDLFTVAAHEFGHSLGLLHSEVNTALMAPFYQPPSPDRKIIKADDIKGIQSLYGAPENVATPPPAPPPDVPNPPDTGSGGGGGEDTGGDTGDADEEDPILCDPDSTIDAMFTVQARREKRTYVFKGGDYWRLTDTAVANGYPQKIADRWGGVPDDIDAVLVFSTRRGRNQVLYFFKGDQVWKMTKMPTVDDGYPKPISEEFEGIPNDIDAAFMWSRNNKLYFFKGDEYWRYDWRAARSGRQAVDDKYPQSMDVWKGVPGNLATANTWKNGKTYFFAQNEYYKLRDRPLGLANGYPRNTGEWWFGCQGSPDSIQLRPSASQQRGDITAEESNGEGFGFTDFTIK